MFEQGVKFTFSASHKLDRLPRDHRCAGLHGHTYTVTIFVKGEDLDEDGFLLSADNMDWFGNMLREKFDGKHLNDVMHISSLTTPDNLAAHFFNCAKDVYGDIVDGCRVSDSPNTYSEYRKSHE